jgi:hypothetical protein
MLILVVIINVLWYTTKFILREKGYAVSWFIYHCQDFPHMRDLISKESDIESKRKYKIILYSLYTSMLLLLLSLVAQFSNLI